MMTTEQALEHLLNMSRDAARPHAFHHTSDVAVQLLRSRLAVLENEVERLTAKLSESGTCTERFTQETLPC